MAIFYNIILKKECVELLDDLKFSEIVLHKLNSSTTVVAINNKCFFNKSVYISVNKFVDIDTYKKEILQIVNILKKNNCSFLVTFNGDIPVIFYSKDYFSIYKEHFARFDINALLNGKIELEISKVTFDITSVKH